MNKINEFVRILCVGLSIAAVRFGIDKVLHPTPAPMPEMKHSIFKEWQRLNDGKKVRTDSLLRPVGNPLHSRPNSLTELRERNSGETKKYPPYPVVNL